MLFQACALTGLLAITAASPAPVTPVRRQAASLCEQYGYYAANGYEFNNNNWGKGSGSGSQCTTVQSTSSSSVSWSTQWQWSGGQDNVKSYANAGKQFARGIKVSNVKSLPTNIQWDYQPRDGVRANVAYDVFTAADPNHDKSSGDYELMVWLARMGGVYPIGNKVTTVTLAGYSWDLYVGPNGSMKVFSFIPSDGSWKFSFNADLKLFFNYLAQNQGYPINNQHLIVFQQGTEPFTGGPTKYTVSSYSASVNQ